MVADMQIEQPLIHMVLIDETGLASHHWQRWIIGIQRQLHSGFLGDGDDPFQKPGQPLPQLVVGDRGQVLVWGVLVIDHIPDHSLL